MDKKTKRQTLITFYFTIVIFRLSTIVIDPLFSIIAENIVAGFSRIGITFGDPRSTN